MKKYNIPFNKTSLVGRELENIQTASNLCQLSGNGYFTKLCHKFISERFGFPKVLLTTSCTTSLELAALLAMIKPGDEIILPSYTFVSTANAFALRGATLNFVDSQIDNPNIDHQKIEELITKNTKAIVVVHYAGIACQMNEIMKIARRHNLLVFEDAAQAIDSFYEDKPLGSFGDFSSFSFHETKNISSGEGGMLIVNNLLYQDRADILWEKGTNRAAFFRGEVDKYTWVDIGSSFLPSELCSAFLYAQLECMDIIHKKRREIWNRYFLELQCLDKNGILNLPKIPAYSNHNAHIFFLVCKNIEQRTFIIQHLERIGIQAIFHYQALHSSPYFTAKHGIRILQNADKFSNTLLRLPLYISLTKNEQDLVIEEVIKAANMTI